MIHFPKVVLEFKGNALAHDSYTIDGINERLRLRLEYVADADLHSQLGAGHDKHTNI